MTVLLTVVAVALLLTITYQDFKERMVSVELFIYLAVVLFVKGLLETTTSTYLSGIGMNLLVVGVNILLLSLYCSIKQKKITNIFDRFLGWGDVLFFALLTLSFSVFNFYFFFISSLVLSLIIYLLFQKRLQHTIPLAGLMAGCLSIVLTGQLLFNYSTYNDNYWIALLI